MSAPRLLLFTFMAFAATWLTGCGTLNLFGDKASGAPASVGGSIRIPLGGSDQGGPRGDH